MVDGRLFARTVLSTAKHLKASLRLSTPLWKHFDETLLPVSNQNSYSTSVSTQTGVSTMSNCFGWDFA